MTDSAYAYTKCSSRKPIKRIYKSLKSDKKLAVLSITLRGLLQIYNTQTTFEQHMNVHMNNYFYTTQHHYHLERADVIIAYEKTPNAPE